jgi:hypothetical protein
VRSDQGASMRKWKQTEIIPCEGKCYLSNSGDWQCVYHVSNWSISEEMPHDDDGHSWCLSSCQNR